MSLKNDVGGLGVSEDRRPNNCPLFTDYSDLLEWGKGPSSTFVVTRV